MTTWPKFLLRAWPNEPRRVISREEAKKLGFDDRSLNWLEQRQVVGTENYRRDALSLYTQEDAARDAAPELLKAARMALTEFVDLCDVDETLNQDAKIGETMRTLQAAIAKAEGRE